MYEIVRVNKDGEEVGRYGIVSREDDAVKISQLLTKEEIMRKVEPEFSYYVRPLVCMTDEMTEQVINRLEHSVDRLEKAYDEANKSS